MNTTTKEDGVKTVKISAALAAEYECREAWENDPNFPELMGLRKPGTYVLSTEAAREVIADAEFQSDPGMAIDLPPGARKAYRAVARQIQNTLKGVGQ